MIQNIISYVLILIFVFPRGNAFSFEKDPSALYESVLAVYSIMIDKVKNGELCYSMDIEDVASVSPEASSDWRNMWIEVNSSYIRADEKFDFGYTFADLDRDGKAELMLMTNDQTLLALFTSSNGNPVLVDAFWPRHSGAVIANNKMLIRSSGGADEVLFSVSELKAGCLYLIFQCNSTRNIESQKTEYYCEIGSFSIRIPQYLFDLLSSIYYL